MGLRYRPIQSKDVDECVKIIATHPVIGPRYGSAIADLPSAWLRLLDEEAKATAVIEEVKGSRSTICFVGVALFVGDDFARELKSPPLRWFGPELAMRIARGNSPLLSSRQLREANSGCGLNSVTWEGCIRPGFEERSEVHRKIVSAYIEEHRGYLWKEAIASQMESVERLHWTLDSGGMLWDPASGRYVKSLEKAPHEIISEPHIVGVTREADHGRPGSWVGALFDYHPPQIGFSRSEQGLLFAALPGKTDEDLSEELGMSPLTVKSMWRSIYNRAASCMPELFPDPSSVDQGISERGKEKRRRLLVYLREHPEELRPISPRLLQQAATQHHPAPKYRSA